MNCTYVLVKLSINTFLAHHQMLSTVTIPKRSTYVHFDTIVFRK